MSIQFPTLLLSALAVTTAFAASTAPAQDAAQIREPSNEEVRVPASEKENVPN